jgi:hypothetical protein
LSSSWNDWIQGSSVFNREHKLKSIKLAIKEWIKLKVTNEKKSIEELLDKMEDMFIQMELDPITPSLLIEEQSNFKEYQKILKVKEED